VAESIQLKHSRRTVKQVRQRRGRRMESKRSGDVKKLLLSLGDALGTQYTHFMTNFDRRWTALRGGKRILVRALDVDDPEEATRITTAQEAEFVWASCNIP